jgi:hypothetical protein
MPKFKELTKSLSDIKQQLRTEGETLLAQEFQEVFDKTPGLYAIHWTQGTPGFNDGDPCYFSVHEICAYESKEKFDQGQDEGDPEEFAWDIPKDQAKPFNDLIKALGENEELLEIVYGDNQSITITRKKDGSIKTETEEWDMGY